MCQNWILQNFWNPKIIFWNLESKIENGFQKIHKKNFLTTFLNSAWKSTLGYQFSFNKTTDKASFFFNKRYWIFKKIIQITLKNNVLLRTLQVNKTLLNPQILVDYRLWHGELENCVYEHFLGDLWYLDSNLFFGIQNNVGIHKSP